MLGIGGSLSEGSCVIYKCNKYPVRFFREAPPPKTVLTLNELPYILGVEGVIMPKIYEYNPDTDTVRERERVKMKEKDMIAMMMEDNRSDHINPDRAVSYTHLTLPTTPYV